MINPFVELIRKFVCGAALVDWEVSPSAQTSRNWPGPIAAVAGYLEPFRIVNGYGLFRVMTKTRLEIVIEGSADGMEWKPYDFRWKPGDVKRSLI